MLVAIYLRKSRANGIEDLEKHREQLISIANNNSWDYDIYQEIASSQDNQREEYNKMKNNLHKYSKILVTSLDRLSREKSEQAELTKLINKFNFEIVTPAGNYSKDDDLLMDIRELLARQEYKLIRERQIQGTISSWKSGRWTGGKPTLGYSYNKNNRMLEVDDNKEIYLYIKSLALQGENPTKIALLCNQKGYKTIYNKYFSAMQVSRILTCKTYIGQVCYSGKWNKGLHEPLCSLEEYSIIMDYMEKKSLGKRKRGYTYPLSGLIKCKVCGSLYQTHRRKDRDNNEYLKPCHKRDKISNIKCRNKGIKADIIHQIIIEQLNNFIEETEEIIKNGNINSNKNSIKMLDSELSTVKADINGFYSRNDNILKMVEIGMLDILEGKKKIDTNNKEINLLKDRIDLLELKKANLKKIDIKDKLKISKNVFNEIINLDNKDSKNDIKINSLYKSIINYIEIDIKSDSLDLYIDFK